MAPDEMLRRLLAGCDEAQRDAITTDAAPLLIVAGAGSGKTRVLTRRIARRVADGTASPARTLALTFTRRAAGELRGRLHALGLPDPVTAGTFHAVALGELRRRAFDQDAPPPVVLDSKARLLARLLPDRYALGTGDRARPAGRSDVLGAVAAEIEWAKARCVRPEGYAAAAVAAGRASGLDADLVVSIFLAYEREKRRRRVLDFDDLLSVLADAIEVEPDFAASQRWRYRHFFVDELQDASAAQLRLLDAWLGGRGDLCAVGDPRQAIYGWNGALADVVESFSDRHRDATVLRLEENYRSTPQVVTVATTALGPGAPPGPRVRRPDGPVPSLIAYESDEVEAAGVAAAARSAHRPGRRWSSLAVLARTNAQLVCFELALTGAGIPFRSGGGPSLLSSPAVRAELDSIADPTDSATFVARIDDLELRQRDVRSHDARRAAFEGGARTSSDDALDALLALAREYRSGEIRPTAAGFQTWARAALRHDGLPGFGDAVTLSTFHRAKGLEWPVVFVTGLEDGLVPIAQARTPAALGEERRLLYVALSRAREELHCSWAARRRFGVRAVSREPSPYLEAIESARQALERIARPDPDAARAGIAAGRAQLARGHEG
ncbi:MAG TPA: ATP-dependent helicase [Acidimicrobiales bacterium]|nr:ATP-dependent helicase [Acidimicrobiales bacterium]